MDKLLALAVNFAKAPKSLQDAATAQFEVESRIEKMKSDIATLQKELQAAEIEQGEKAKITREELKKYAPDAVALIDSQVRP